MKRVRVPEAPLAFSTKVAMLIIGIVVIITTIGVTEVPIPGTSLPWFVIIAVIAVVALTKASEKLPTHESPPYMEIAVWGFRGLIAYATLTALLHHHYIGSGDETTFTFVPLSWILPPLFQAWLAMEAADRATQLIAEQDMFRVLWWFAAAGAVVTPIGWGINLTGDTLPQFGRLATRLGGAAVLHILLLLGLAIAITAARSRFRTRISLGLIAAYLAFILLSISRGALIDLAVFAALLVVPAVARRLTQKKLETRPLLISIAVGVTSLALVANYVLEVRGTDITTDGRWQTWVGAFETFVSSVTNFVLGTGYGIMWPWHAIERGPFGESGFYGLMDMPHGPSLGHAHNLYLAVAGELGVIGLILLGASLLGVLWCFRHANNNLERSIAAALLATLVGFAFDTYLIKNFPLSMLWWGTYFACATMIHRRRKADAQSPKN